MKKVIKLPPGMTPAEAAELEDLMREVGPKKVKKMAKEGYLMDTLKSRVKNRQDTRMAIYYRLLEEEASKPGARPVEELTIWAATRASELEREWRNM
jgi:hypothetical protein